MLMNIHSKNRERRRKRLLTPVVYLIVELIFIWLLLSLIQLSFDFQSWAIWSYVVGMVLSVYAVAKMLYIYHRQKRYKE